MSTALLMIDIPDLGSDFERREMAEAECLDHALLHRRGRGVERIRSKRLAHDSASRALAFGLGDQRRNRGGASWGFGAPTPENIAVKVANILPGISPVAP